MHRNLQRQHGYLPVVAEVSVMSNKTEQNMHFQKLPHSERNLLPQQWSAQIRKWDPTCCSCFNKTAQCRRFPALHILHAVICEKGGGEW